QTLATDLPHQRGLAPVRARGRAVLGRVLAEGLATRARCAAGVGDRRVGVAVVHGVVGIGGAAIGVRDVDAPFGVEGDVVEVEHVAAAAVGATGGTTVVDAATLHRIEGRCVDDLPAVAAVVGVGDV